MARKYKKIYNFTFKIIKSFISDISVTFYFHLIKCADLTSDIEE